MCCGKFFRIFVLFVTLLIASHASAKVSSSEYMEAIDSLLLPTLETDFEKVDLLMEYPTPKSYEAVKKKVEAILDEHLVPLNENYIREVIGSMTRLILAHLGVEDSELIREYISWAKLSSPSLPEEFTIDLDILEERISSSSKIQPQLNEFTDVFSDFDSFKESAKEHEILALEDSRSLSERADFFLKKLQENVIDQEDILKALQVLYMKDELLKVQRKRPELFYFMGLPGSGKDTIAEAYTNALWSDDNAYKDHMFRMSIRTKEGANNYFGSSKGYVGSEDLPDFLKFLVNHSGGKYILKKEDNGRGGTRSVVYKNPDWNPNSPQLSDSTPPNKAVVFVNEAHNIPKSVKDNVLKEAIERGIFPITNSGSGSDAASYIELPVTFIFASNEGIDLLEPREKNGTRIGAPYSYERLLENYDRVKNDKSNLKEAILKNNGEKNNPIGADQPGTSEEFLNRIPNNRIFMLKPLDKAALKSITLVENNRFNLEISTAKNQRMNFEVTLTDEALDFITSFNHIPSENARPIKGHLKNYIYDQIYQALLNGKIKASNGEKKTITVGAKKYTKGAFSIEFKVDTDQGSYQFTRLVKESLNNIPQKPITDERVEEILSMRKKILENVFGIEHIVDELIKSALVSESESKNSGQSKRPATVMAFLGKSSTGKTETAKQYVNVRYGENERPAIIDFNGIQSLKQLEAKILGSVDQRNNAIPSEFMKAYDRAQDGNIAFIFDEAANAPKDLLRSLYEILREPVVTSFSDGKARPMRNVTVILTGNAGEQIYNDIPKGLPDEIYERALHEVFRIFMHNKNLQQDVLKESFTEAFLARLGQNIFHFGPLSSKTKRQITQLKIKKGIDSLKAKPSERGWNIKFDSESDLLNLFDMVETAGFSHAYQGASIDRFVRESLVDRLKSTLLENKVSNNSDVILKIPSDFTTESDKTEEYSFKNLKLIVEDGQEIDLKIPLGMPKNNILLSDLDKTLTAYHEAGHEIVSEVYFGDRIRPEYLTIIDGVALIDGQLIAYSGIRAGKYLQATVLTKEAVLREVAILLGGYVAQQIVTVGNRDDSGKSNDIERATRLIKYAVLKSGLSDRWSMKSANEGALSNSDKELLSDIIKEWLYEGEKMAKEALLINSVSVLPNMSKRIAEKGFISSDEILDIYKNTQILTERDGESFDMALEEVRSILSALDSAYLNIEAEFKSNFKSQNYTLDNAKDAYDFVMKKNSNIFKRFLFKSSWDSLTDLQKAVAGVYFAGKVNDSTRDARLSSEAWWPKSVTNINDYIKKERLESTEPVTRFEDFEYVNSKSSPKGLSCKAILL